MSREPSGPIRGRTKIAAPAAGSPARGARAANGTGWTGNNVRSGPTGALSHSRRWRNAPTSRSYTYPNHRARTAHLPDPHSAFRRHIPKCAGLPSVLFVDDPPRSLRSDDPRPSEEPTSWREERDPADPRLRAGSMGRRQAGRGYKASTRQGGKAGQGWARWARLGKALGGGAQGGKWG